MEEKSDFKVKSENPNGDNMTKSLGVAFCFLKISRNRATEKRLIRLFTNRIITLKCAVYMQSAQRQQCELSYERGAQKTTTLYKIAETNFNGFYA